MYSSAPEFPCEICQLSHFSLPTKLLHSAGSDQLPLPTSLVTWENMWKPFSAFVCQEVDSTIKHTKISPAEICTARSLYRFTSTSFCAGIGPKLPILVCRPHRGKFESACLPVGLSQGSLLASFLYWIWEQLQCLSLNPWNHERYRQRERTCNLFFFCAVAFLTNSRAWWCVHLQNNRSFTKTSGEIYSIQTDTAVRKTCLFN